MIKKLHKYIAKKSRLIFIDRNNSDVKYLKFRGIINHSFSINRQIYVALDTGLYKLVNGQPELIIGSLIGIIPQLLLFSTWL